MRAGNYAGKRGMKFGSEGELREGSREWNGEKELWEKLTRDYRGF